MRPYAILLIVGTLIVAAFVVMSGRSRQMNQQATSQQPESHYHGGSAMAYSGEVIETMDAGGYTYVYVDTGEEKIWAAGPETVVKVGDKVTFGTGMEMTDFESPALNRTFEQIYFVTQILTGESPGHAPAGHPVPTDVPDLDYSDIEVADGGHSIESLYAGKPRLAGSDVTVRGKVVKFTPGVMQRNWIHLRDGTGADGANDLAVTTDAVVRVGDVVLVRGQMAIDKDFGYGYEYEILVENASVTIETVQ